MSTERTELLQWAGCATGIIGSTLLALNRPGVSGFGFVAFLVSNSCRISYALMAAAHSLAVKQVVFTATSVLGVWRWLVVPARRAGAPLLPEQSGNRSWRPGLFVMDTPASLAI